MLALDLVLLLLHVQLLPNIFEDIILRFQP